MEIKQLFPQKKITILLLVFVIFTSISAAIYGGDFDVFLDAGRKLGKGQNIYAYPFVKGLQYYYSNFFALLLMPFSYQIFIVELLWSILSYFLLYRAFKLFEGYIDFSFLTIKQKQIWLFTTIFLSVQFILYNVSMIQVTFFFIVGNI